MMRGTGWEEPGVAFVFAVWCGRLCVWWPTTTKAVGGREARKEWTGALSSRQALETQTISDRTGKRMARIIRSKRKERVVRVTGHGDEAIDKVAPQIGVTH